MSYEPITNFEVKDTLGPNDPNKIIYGKDLQVEFDAIAFNLDAIDDEIDGGGVGAGMVISDKEPSDPADGMQWLDSTTAIVWVWDEDKWLEFPAGKTGPEGPPGSGSGSEYDDTEIRADLATETQARAAGDAGLQTQIDNLDLSGDAYDDTQVKADIAANTAEIAKKLDASAYVPYDDTQVKADIAANTADISTKLDADKIWTGTEAQYNALSPDANTLYFITS